MGKIRILIVILLGISIVSFGWIQEQNEQSDVQQAVTVEGTVQSTDVEYVGSTGGSGNPSGGHHEVIVRYTYTYQGQEYTSESVYPGPEKRQYSKEDAQEVANQYSPGQTTTVYVNQEDPSRAFLIKDTTEGGPFGIMEFGAGVVVLGIIGLGREIVVGGSDD